MEPVIQCEGYVLRRVVNNHSIDIDSYEKDGGYSAAKKAITQMSPQQVIDCVKASGLRGKGGAGFPCGMKWDFVPKPNVNPKPRYIVCNADESEPGTFKDRVLIERDPHAIIEGMIIGGYAVGSNCGYIYIRGEMHEGYEILWNAVHEAYAKGYLGKGIFGSGFNFDVTVHKGAGAYICGEETALLNSLEGKRGLPRIKPPFPANVGLFGCPTVVNNVETLATVPHIINNGPEWFRKVGTEKSPGTKIFGVCGNVKKPGLYELPFGVPLRKIIFDYAGGIDEGKLKAVIPGGSSTGVMTPEEIDIPMDFDGVMTKGCILGTAAIIVLNDRQCIVRSLHNILKFYHHESCGQCTPCREGTGWIEKIVGRIEKGRGTREDIDLLVDAAMGMVGLTICVLADAAAIPTKLFVQKFRREFEEHVEKKCCPFPK